MICKCVHSLSEIRYEYLRTNLSLLSQIWLNMPSFNTSKTNWLNSVWYYSTYLGNTVKWNRSVLHIDNLIEVIHIANISNYKVDSVALYFWAEYSHFKPVWICLQKTWLDPYEPYIMYALNNIIPVTWIM